MFQELVAIKEVLVEYLQQTLEIDDFKYYQSTISVGDDTKGVIKFFKINKLDPSHIHNLDYSKYLVTVQLFIMFATNSADETENKLLEWCGKLDRAMNEVASQGLLLDDYTNCCMGIRHSSRGIQFYSEEISATGRDRYESWKGTLLAEYEFELEVDSR